MSEKSEGTIKGDEQAKLIQALLSRTGESGDINEKLYSLLEYGVKVDGDVVLKKDEVLPLANSDVPVDLLNEADVEKDPDSLWYYEGVVPVYKLSEGQTGRGAGADYYRYIGKSVEVDVGLRDVYGNRIYLPTEPLRLDKLKFSDPLIGLSDWPGIKAAYSIEKRRRSRDKYYTTIKIEFRVLKERLFGDRTNGGGRTQDDAFTGLEADIAAFEFIKYQLSHKFDSGDYSTQLGVRTTLSVHKGEPVQVPVEVFQRKQLVGELDKIIEELKKLRPTDGDRWVGQKGRQTEEQDPTKLWKWDLDIKLEHSTLSAEVYFPLWFHFCMERDQSLVEMEILDRNVQSVFSARTVIHPYLGEPKVSGKPQDEVDIGRYTDVANDLNLGFPDFNLALGTASNGKPELWVVQSRILQLKARNTAEPIYWSAKPLSTKLKAGEDTMPKVNVVNPEDNKWDELDIGESLEYREVDLDNYARSAYQLMERILEADIAIPARKHARVAFEKLLDAKWRIAAGLTGRRYFEHILEDQIPSEDQRTQAIRAFVDALRINLNNTYSVATVVGCPLTNPCGVKDLRPLLFGSVHLSEVATDKEDKEKAEKNFTVSPVRIDLSQGNPDMDFLFSVRDKGNASIFRAEELNFTVTHIQKAGVASKNEQRFNPAGWLQIVIPQKQELFTKVAIPIILRSYPEPASLIEQTFGETYEKLSSKKKYADKMKLARKWDYSFDYERTRVGTKAQDLVYATLEFNALIQRAILDGNRKAEGSVWRAQSLAQALVAFNESKQNVLDWLKVENDSSKKLKGAVNLVAGLAQELAGQLEVQVELRNAFLSTEKEEYLVQEKVNEDGWNVISFKSDRKLDWFSDNLRFPIQAKLRSGEVLPEGSWKTDVEVEEGNSKWIYRFKYRKNEKFRTEDDEKIWQRRSILRSNNDILSRENALAIVELTRNEKFASFDGNPKNEQDSNDGFVYRTPDVAFAERLIPLVERRELIDVVPRDGAAGSYFLEDLIRDMFEGIGKNVLSEYRFEVEARYAFPIVDSVVNTRYEEKAFLDHRKWSQTKIKLTPATDEVDDASVFYKELSHDIICWMDKNDPKYDEHERLLFRIKLYATKIIDKATGATDEKNWRPILILHNIGIPLRRIKYE